MAHNRIRRVSLDRFYAIVTGEEDAFYQICMALPHTIREVMQDHGGSGGKKDTVYEALRNKVIADEDGNAVNEESAMQMAMYLLGFETYLGFSKEA